ncbi:MAG: glycerol uptake facilitator protein [Cyclobacteriaceae bacterium]|nr:MAG: glycerol uptake facilitator protein [Cyclobacteriaceae bacterium]
MTQFLGELLGTMLLILLGNGVVAGVLLKGSKSENSGWIVITFGWGLAVALAVYAVGGISGAHINPAVTLGLAFAGEFAWELVPYYIIAQMIGAVTGAALVWIHYLPHWKLTSQADLKLAAFATAPAVPRTWANLVSEMIGTFVLVLGLLFIGANQFTEGLNPLVVGLLIFSIGLSLGGTTGYAINPARDLGPRIAHAILPVAGKGPSDWRYSWIPVIGPVIGGVYGALFYNAVFKNQPGAIFWSASLVCLVIVLIAIVKQLQEDKQ